MASTTSPAEVIRRAKRVGLVLGGGGARGAAYHAGALLALWSDARWDARQAEVVVGTSAGSIAAALLGTGVPPDDLAALVVGADLREAPLDLADRWAAAGRSLPSWWHALRGPVRVRRPAVVAAGLRRWRERRDPWPLMASLGSRGSFGLEAALPVIDHPWPDRELWICAVDEETLERTVFGREGDPHPDLGSAVLASCAVPTIMQPVPLGGRTYVDGGLHSPTNADLLVEAELDVAVVVSPMTGSIPRLHPVGALMRAARRHLDAEVAMLEAAATRVVVIEPDRATRAVVGTDLLDGSLQTEVFQAGYFSVGGLLAGRAPAAVRLP